MKLAIAIKNGDQSAFHEAYEQLHAKLFHYFLQKVKVKEEAKELTQQSFIKLWQSRQTLSDTHILDTQCFTIANSILIDYLRKQAVLRKHFISMEDRLLLNTTGACTEADNFENEDYLETITEHLSPVRRNVFLLKIHNGFSNKQVADQLSISVKTVEDHYSKAIRTLKTYITHSPLFSYFFLLMLS